MSASTTTTRADADDGSAEGTDADAARTRRRVRWLSGAVALVLIAAAALVLTRHHPPARTAANFCHEIQAARHLDVDIASGDPARLEASARQLTTAARVAPSAISGPMNVLVGYLDDLAGSVRDARNPDQALRAEVAARAAQNATVSRAGEAVAAYTTTTCGFSLTTTPSTTG